MQIISLRRSSFLKEKLAGFPLQSFLSLIGEEKDWSGIYPEPAEGIPNATLTILNQNKMLLNCTIYNLEESNIPVNLFNTKIHKFYFTDTLQ